MKKSKQPACILKAHFTFFCFVVLTFRAHGAFAQNQLSITAEVAKLISDGQHAMYSCDYNSANQQFDTLIRLFPEHPIGYMYRAECAWWRCLRNTTSKELQNQFLHYSEAGIGRGEALVQKNPKDFYAQMFLAGIYGNETRFHVTITRNTLAGVRAGMKGDKYNRNALALRPDCVDCLIGTGSHDYAPEALPFVLRHFAKLMGVRGDKERSLRNLEMVAAKGEFAQTEAKLVLLGIFYREKWFDKYEGLLMHLTDLYPTNHVFYMWMANFFLEQRRFDEGVKFFSDLVERSSLNPALAQSLKYACLEKGRLELEKKAVSNAVQSLSKGIEAGRGNPEYLAEAHMLRGFALDLLSHRDSAIQEYHTVLALPNVGESHKSASRFTKSPFQGSLWERNR